MTKTNLNLDVASYEQVSDVLREAAEKFIDDSHMLEASWQDNAVGRTWRYVALCLIQAANKIDRKIWREIITRGQGRPTTFREESTMTDREKEDIELEYREIFDEKLYLFALINGKTATWMQEEIKAYRKRRDAEKEHGENP